ncbi:hypothetical protein [Denitratisoma oestradiolicum]|uniref:DUF1579 domain-containing protein n=1 Tax=Denitratisoma oestradiolicum TaxID=311182 RepID=A0A6S6XRL6_9PROT|nr:hypothetical protein [Denitratisoma oestradiolicum]TWO81408.1 hypothetical protein CBW56_04670 [Denitratisoma oestradiolicum]CAB1368606.1 conserved exported protein of unknown function [Denitratisoma oestradiolicum]
MSTSRLCPLAGLLLGLAAATTGAAADTTNKPCQSAAHRQFDFWIGHWQVSTADNTVVGNNRISAIAGGCALLEEWSGADGGSGKSLIVYQPERGRWRQLWADSNSERSDRQGRPGLGGMVLTDAAGPGRRGRNVLRAVSADELRQLEQSSSDGGRTWTTVFKGIYRRLPAQP